MVGNKFYGSERRRRRILCRIRDNNLNCGWKTIVILFVSCDLNSRNQHERFEQKHVANFRIGFILYKFVRTRRARARRKDFESVESTQRRVYKLVKCVRCRRPYPLRTRDRIKLL